MSRHTTIVVDLDGTLVEERWPELGDWLPGAQDFLRRALKRGFRVQVHSCRLHSCEPDTFEKRDLHEQTAEMCRVRKLLDDAGFQAVEIVREDKPPAKVYLDDRAIRFDGDWIRTIMALNNVGIHV